jgi:MFS family permease
MGTEQNNSINQNSEELEKKRSLKYFHGEAGSEGVSEAANAYASASLVAAGAGNSVVAMLSMMNNFVAAFLYIKVPTVIQKMGSRKKAVLLLAFLDAIGWLPLIAILFFFRPVNPLWLIPCWIFNLIPGMLLAPARSSWMADLVPAATRGRYFGTRSAISGAAYIGTFYVIGYVLQLFNGSILQGFVLIFLIAFIAQFITFLIYSRIHNTPVTPEKDTDFGFFDFLGETRQRNLGKFILFVSLFQFTVYISSPFLTPYMLNDLHLSYMLFALVFSTEFLAKVIIVTFWGRYADKVGNLKVMKAVSLAIPFIPLLWLVSPNVGFLVLVQLFSGACWAGFDLCSCNFIYEAALPGKRLKYIAYHKALTTLFMALGALTGAYLLGFMRPVLGHNILALFVLSGVLRLAVTMVMFPKLREVRGTMRSALEQPVMVTTPDAAIVQRQPLLYHPKEWANFGRRPLVLETVPIQDEPVAATRGLFYRPQEWDRFGHPLASDASPVQAEPVATSRGMFYRPREWANLGKSVASKAQSGQAQTRSESVAANWGLFYRPGEWERFGRPQTSEVPQAQAQSKMETPKRGLFHRAHVQAKSDKQSTTGNIMRQMQTVSLKPATVLAL